MVDKQLTESAAPRESATLPTEQEIRTKWLNEQNDIGIDLKFINHNEKLYGSIAGRIPRRWVEIKVMVTLPNGEVFGRRVSFIEVKPKEGIKEASQ